jgi:AI-2 transport protein TqsA
MKEMSRVGVGARFLLTAAAFVVVVAGLRAAESIIIPVLISVFLAILCVPAVSWLRRRRVPTVLAVLLVVLVMMGVMAGFAAIVGGSINQFTDAVPRYQERFNLLATSVAGWLGKHNVQLKGVDVFRTFSPSSILGMLGGALKGLVSALSNTVLVLLTLVFILFEAAGLPGKLRAALGDANADLGRFNAMTRRVQQYLVIKTALSLVTGLIIGVWLAILGVDFAVLWGFLAFILNYIPNIGSIVAAVPAVLLAFIQFGVGKAVLATIAYLVVNTVLGNVVEPATMGRRLGLSTLVVFLSLVFWGWVWGPVGMLLSVPLTMVLKISLEYSDDLRWLAILLDSSGTIAREGT